MYSKNMLSINEKIKSLSLKKQKEFRKVLNECFYDRTWCAMHGVNYIKLLDEDVLHAKEALYKEIFQNPKN